MNRRTIHFAGRVQGVGFRYTAHNIASRYPVTGYVKNLPEGEVLLVMEGEDGEMDKVVQEITSHMEAHIKSRNNAVSPATGEFNGFSIRH